MGLFVTKMTAHDAIKEINREEKTLRMEIGLPLTLRIKLMERTGIHTTTEITNKSTETFP